MLVHLYHPVFHFFGTFTRVHFCVFFFPVQAREKEKMAQRERERERERRKKERERERKSSRAFSSQKAEGIHPMLLGVTLQYMCVVRQFTRSGPLFAPPSLPPDTVQGKGFINCGHARHKNPSSYLKLRSVTGTSMWCESFDLQGACLKSRGHMNDVISATVLT